MMRLVLVLLLVVAGAAAFLVLPALFGETEDRPKPRLPRERPLSPGRGGEPKVPAEPAAELLKRIAARGATKETVDAFLSLGDEAGKAVLERLQTRGLPSMLRKRADELKLEPEPLLRIATDPEKPRDARSDAFALLRHHRGPEVDLALRRAVLREKDTIVLFSVIQVVGFRSDPELCDALLRRFRRERDSPVEKALLRALGQARCEEAIPLIRGRLLQDDAGVFLLEPGVRAVHLMDAPAGRELAGDLLRKRSDLPPEIRAALEALAK